MHPFSVPGAEDAHRCLRYVAPWRYDLQLDRFRAAGALNYAPYIMAVWLLLGIIVVIALWLTQAERVRQFGKILGE